jgi:hypothetical protein
LAKKSRNGRKEGKLSFRSPGRRKALKGEPHECRELKEASRGARQADTIERVAKP